MRSHSLLEEKGPQGSLLCPIQRASRHHERTSQQGAPGKVQCTSDSSIKGLAESRDNKDIQEQQYVLKRWERMKGRQENTAMQQNTRTDLEEKEADMTSTTRSVPFPSGKTTKS